MRALVLGACLAAATFSSGCRDQRPAASAIPSDADRYTVRGVVTRLPAQASTGSTSRSIFIHHEPIPGFKDWQGSAVGMGEMTMEFPLARDIVLDGVQIGDVVEAEIAVWFVGRAGSWVTTRLEELPADTALNLQDPPGMKNP